MGHDRNGRIRWGILGCARISRRGLIPGIQGSRGGTLTTLASRDPATSEAWSREFGVPKSAGSYEEVLADPEIDAVYIPLPNELHRKWVHAAADAGKHVLCEKPLALDVAEARDMVDYCRDRGVILMEAFMWRHQPRSLAIRKMVAEGAIGTLRLIRVSFSFSIDPGDWRLDSSRGGGALWDVGCYGVNAARFFSGTEPKSLWARAHFWKTGVDMSLVAGLEFPGDLVATIDCSFEQPYRCAYELVGTEGSIEVPDAFLPPSEGPPLARVRAIQAGTSPWDDKLESREIAFDRTNQYSDMVDAFAESVATGALTSPAEDGLAQMEAIEAVLKAARGG